jgi:putative transposase
LNLLKQYRKEPVFISGGGYYKLTKYLAVEHGMYINHKKIYRICSQNGLLLYKIDKSFIKPKKRRCGYQSVTGPNQLWQFDIKYGYIHGEAKWFFILAFIDVFTKKVVAYYIGKNCKAGDLIYTLNEALKNEGITNEHQLKIRSDNGPQMSSNRFFFYLKRLEQKLEHEFIPPRTPDRNAFIEAFFSILEKELLEEAYFFNFVEAYTAVVNFIQFYNHRRLHSSIGYKSPAMFIDALNNGTVTPREISV